MFKWNIGTALSKLWQRTALVNKQGTARAKLAPIPNLDLWESPANACRSRMSDRGGVDLCHLILAQAAKDSWTILMVVLKKALH
eukprot:11599524-Karenia_brevis.AAC.1